MQKLIEKLRKEKNLTNEEMKRLIINRNAENSEFLYKNANETAKENFGNKIYIRGLIEISNYCKNDCYYCGIRRSNQRADRYRLTKDDILRSCSCGYESGFRTFVLQGGEDMYFNDEIMTDIISSIKKEFSDCAVTLSLGERSYESYLSMYQAGADRYLLRHESYNKEHYQKLHPLELSLENRIKCLYTLKDIGYQVGTGFMVGSPYQTVDNIVEDLRFIKEFNPHMVGMGPFICHKDTPFKNEKTGDVELTVFLLAIIRLMLPKALIPATTAVATLDKDGRKKAVLAGANVIMPNISPVESRAKYSLYNNKLSNGKEAGEHLKELNKALEKIGYKIVVSRGDYNHA